MVNKNNLTKYKVKATAVESPYIAPMFPVFWYLVTFDIVLNEKNVITRRSEA